MRDRLAARWESRISLRSIRATEGSAMCYQLLGTSQGTSMRDDENLTMERPTFVTHLECSATGERYAADELHNLSRVGKPLLVRYDLDGVRSVLSKSALAERPHDLWRYRELLPVRRLGDIVSLGEAVTPIVAMPKLAKMLATTEILVKDE